MESGYAEEVYHQMLHHALIEGAGAVLNLVAFILLTAAAIKLARCNDMPGAKLMLGSIIFIVCEMVYVLYIEVLEIEQNDFMASAVDLAASFAFLVGACGFWRLARYVGSSARPPTSRKCSETALEKVEAG